MIRPSIASAGRRARAALSGVLAFLAAGWLLAAAAPAHAQAQVNDPAPDFTFTNLLPGPATVTLSEFRGSVVVLTAFAYW